LNWKKKTLEQNEKIIFQVPKLQISRNISYHSKVDVPLNYGLNYKRIKSLRDSFEKIKLGDSAGIGIVAIITKNDPFQFIQHLTQKLILGVDLLAIKYQFRSTLQNIQDKPILYACLDYLDGTIRQQEKANLKYFYSQGTLAGLEMIAIPTLALSSTLGAYFISPVLACLIVPTICIALNLKDRLKAFHSDSYDLGNLVLPRLLNCRDLLVQRMVESGIQL